MTTVNAQALQILGIAADNPKAEAILRGWLVALDITDTCSRCAGSGHYSWNAMTGTRCFKCASFHAGKTPRKVTRATIALLRAKVAAGEVDRIRAERKANAEALRSLAALERAARAQYDRISNRYETAYQAARGVGEHVAEDILRAQTMANAVFWGDHDFSATDRSAHGVIRAVELRTRKDYVRCAQDVREAIEALRMLADAWETYQQARGA